MKRPVAYLLVECDKCGALVGEKCTTKRDHKKRSAAAHYYTRGYNNGRSSVFAQQYAVKAYRIITEDAS